MFNTFVQIINRVQKEDHRYTSHMERIRIMQEEGGGCKRTQTDWKDRHRQTIRFREL